MGRERLIEVLRQDIAGLFQQILENKKFVDITEQCFALLPQVDNPAKKLNFPTLIEYCSNTKVLIL